MGCLPRTQGPAGGGERFCGWRARLLSSGDILLNLAPRFTAQDGQEVEVISAAASLVLVPGTWSVLAASTKPSVQQSWALVLGQGGCFGGRSQNLGVELGPLAGYGAGPGGKGK